MDPEEVCSLINDVPAKVDAASLTARTFQVYVFRRYMVLLLLALTLIINVALFINVVINDYHIFSLKSEYCSSRRLDVKVVFQLLIGCREVAGHTSLTVPFSSQAMTRP